MSEQRNWYDTDRSDDNRNNAGSNNSGYNNSNNSGNYNGGYNNSNNSGNYNGGYNNNGYGSYGYSADPPGTNRRFAGASLGLGIASLALLWTGVFSMITGAVGTLFGLLSKRKDKGFPRRGRAGFTMSMIGMFAGLFMTVYSLFYVFMTVSPKELYQQMQDTYEQMYGQEFDPSEYGIDSDLYNYDSFQDYLEQNAGNVISQ